MSKHYVFPHTEQTDKDRYKFFNESELFGGKRKKRKEPGISTDENVTTRRRRVRFNNDDEKEEYIPQQTTTREERAERRANHVIPYEKHGRDSRNRKIYTFSKPIFKKMYRLLWASENKLEKIQKDSTWNQVNNRYFWVTYYMAKKIIYECIQAYKKYDIIKDNNDAFKAAFGPEERNEYYMKYSAKLFKLRSHLDELIDYWMQNLRVRLHPIAVEKENPYMDLEGIMKPDAVLKNVKKTYKRFEKEEKKKEREVKKLDKMWERDQLKEKKKELRRLARETVLKERKEQREINKRIRAEHKQEILKKFVRENLNAGMKEFNQYYKENFAPKKLKLIRENKLQHFLDTQKEGRSQEVGAMLADPNSKFQKYLTELVQARERDKEKARLKLTGRVLRSHSKPIEFVPEPMHIPKRFGKNKKHK